MISNEDGKLQINGAGLLSEYIGQCMKLYNETDGVEDILVINPKDGHFEIINALDNAGIEAKVNSGAIQTSTTWIDFDDPQMLATPQLGTITPA
jgi:predicted aspartyl protease